MRNINHGKDFCLYATSKLKVNRLFSHQGIFAKFTQWQVVLLAAAEFKRPILSDQLSSQEVLERILRKYYTTTRHLNGYMKET